MSHTKDYALAPFFSVLRCLDKMAADCQDSENDFENMLRVVCCCLPFAGVIALPALAVATIASPFGFFAGACHDAVDACRGKMHAAEGHAPREASLILGPNHV